MYRRVDYCSLGRWSPYHSHATAATVLKVDYIMSVQKSGKAQGHCTTEKGSSPIIILLLYSAKDIQCPPNYSKTIKDGSDDKNNNATKHFYNSDYYTFRHPSGCVFAKPFHWSLSRSLSQL